MNFYQAKRKQKEINQHFKLFFINLNTLKDIIKSEIYLDINHEKILINLYSIRLKYQRRIIMSQLFHGSMKNN